MATMPGLRMTTKCDDCGHTWSWHRKWFKDAFGHETEFGHCSCGRFVSKVGEVEQTFPTPEPEQPEEVTVIDLQPTWLQIMPSLVRVAIFASTAEARKAGWDELKKMAGLADALVEHRRAGCDLDKAETH